MALVLVIEMILAAMAMKLPELVDTLAKALASRHGHKPMLAVETLAAMPPPQDTVRRVPLPPRCLLPLPSPSPPPR